MGGKAKKSKTPSRQASATLAKSASRPAMTFDSQTQVTLQAAASRMAEDRTPSVKMAPLELAERAQADYDPPNAPVFNIPQSKRFNPATVELACARTFNFELPEDLAMAVQLMEGAITRLTQTRKSLILIYDETTGTYTCLNDEKDPRKKPREITQLSDGFLQELLGSTSVIHTYLYARHTLMGIVAVADKFDGTKFQAEDEATLDVIGHYLSTKVLSFMTLKASLTLPYAQDVMLDISNRLISAVDQQTIVQGIFESLGARLGFDVCQYVSLDIETHEGLVLYEVNYKKTGGSVLAGFDQALVQEEKCVPEFAALVSLFASVARPNPFLHIPGKTLGDKKLSTLFGVPNIHSALILPVMEANTNRIRGTVNLFKTEPAIISQEVLHIVKEVVELVSLALTRACALEHALAMASSDELTGLTNRRGFYERFEMEIERARRHNPAPLCVAMVDVDHFKDLNDTYGHLNGDLVLKDLAQHILKNVRKSDLVCRFGGEEFALLLPDTALADAVDLLERIRKKVHRHSFQGANHEAMKVAISAGVTQVDTTPMPKTTPKKLQKAFKAMMSAALDAADEQLYKAKAQGRNRVVFEDSTGP